MIRRDFRNVFVLLGLLSAVCFSCAQKARNAIPYTSYAKYPLLNTTEQVLIYGDPEIPLEQLKKNGNAYHKASVLRYSALCKLENYTCVPMKGTENEPQRPVYALDSRNTKENSLGTFEIQMGLTEAKRIESVIVYLPPRAETGLNTAEVRLVDAVVR